jgi:hypothetical protein
VRHQLQRFYQFKFEQLASNSEKKFALRAFIFLDCLLTFQRLPTHIEMPPEELVKKLKTIPQVVDHLLQNFSQTAIKAQGRPASLKLTASEEDASQASLFKHIKTKDNTKDLTCHMIAIMGLLNK